MKTSMGAAPQLAGPHPPPLNNFMSTHTVFNQSQQHQIEQQEKLDSLVDITDQPIFSVRSVFPFTLFPDQLNIDRTKVDIVYGIFFFSKQVFPILIKDIRNVSVSTDVLFGKITIEIIGFETNPPSIGFLPRQQALQAHRLIMGLVTCYKEGLDVTEMQIDKIVDQVEKIGQPQVAI